MQRLYYYGAIGSGALAPQDLQFMYQFDYCHGLLRSY
jgi:hypothetical protein